MKPMKNVFDKACKIFLHLLLEVLFVKRCNSPVNSKTKSKIKGKGIFNLKHRKVMKSDY